ncbi:MBL fold metallo-hydrolase [Mycolicibacterium novocastrense]|uniref:MBL fold metallo-hydrolase n=1 Tax=Mycolicibacterium novocastrense TaxID=59813 RepID=A0AAW5SML3_MYCNV|nr:MBL fold metallo-hydrolase [Mycolicibacterium novocastrense]MCV7024337.1 MBL fold metallo-hydrolase [Mycolicibacterium novocastrense]GAT08072.1 metallo-beta-lactamase domain protein [Mycolicibacterium novocastrense]
MALVVDPLDDIGVIRLSRWIFNCYLICGEHSYVVVDAGMPGSADDVAGALLVHEGTVGAVVATHGHSDHAAGAPRLAAEYGAALHLPEVTLGYLDGTRRPRTPALSKVAQIWPTLISQPLDLTGLRGFVDGARIAGYGGAKGMVGDALGGAQPLADGQPLPGATSWEVLHVPGHTDDSTAFWHADSRTLISGDAVLSAGGRAWFTPETVDDAAAARSEQRMRALPVEHLLPGHGLPVHRADVWADTR